MMVVMPALAKGEDADKDVIATLVSTSIGLRAPDVTDRVHAPSDVMDDHDPNQPTPDKSEKSTSPESFSNQNIGHPAKDRGDYKADGDPEWKQTADGPNPSVSDQVGNVAIQRLAGSIEDPTNVSVPEARQNASEPVSMVVQMR